MAENNWLENAKTAVAADAEVAIEMCKDTAEKQSVELYWVIERFIKEFCERAKRMDGEGR